MKLWHNLPELGKCWSFSYRVKNEINANGAMVAANTIFPALWPVVRPLSVTLIIMARSCKRPFNVLYIPSLVRTWHLCEEEVPAHVAVTALVKASGPSQHSEEAKRGLTPQILADWLARAHVQQLPEEYIPVLDSLYMYFTLARLLECQEPSAELTWGPKTYAISLEKREDGLWMSGPISYTTINPPIKVTLYNSSGRLVLTICVCWSPWVEAGSAEAELLRTCLHELEKHGWEAN